MKRLILLVLIMVVCCPLVACNNPSNSIDNTPKVKIELDKIGFTPNVYANQQVVIPTAYIADDEVKSKEISVSVKTESDSKYYDVYEWYWEEFPFSEEEWNSMFMEGEAFSLDGYENIKYQSIGADVFMLSTDEELWFIQLFPDNRTETSFYVWSIDKLILLE